MAPFILSTLNTYKKFSAILCNVNFHTPVFCVRSLKNKKSAVGVENLQYLSDTLPLNCFLFAGDRMSRLAITILFTLLMSIGSPLSAQPPLTLQTHTGEEVSLNSLFGQKPVYLKFWATWCKPCMQQMPHFQRSYEQYGDKIQFIAINIDLNDNADAVAKVENQFSLTMPMYTDHTAKVAKHYEFLGTPFHVLIDNNQNVIFQGHDADQPLDNTLRLLSHNGRVDKVRLLNEKQKSGTQLVIPKDAKKAVLFTTTWCDWYLADTRPQMAKQCVLAQKYINELAVQGIDVEVKVSQLWTDHNAVAEYVKKFTANMPVSIDYGNDLFIEYGINSVPSLLIFENGKRVAKREKF